MISQFHMTPHNRPHLIDKLNKLDPHVIWTVSAKPRKSTRSLEQNRRLWDLYGALGEFLGEDKDRVHELMGYKFLRYQDIIAGEAVEMIKSTTKLNTEDMAAYQDAIERWGAQLGFVWGE